MNVQHKCMLGGGVVAHTRTHTHMAELRIVRRTEVTLSLTSLELESVCQHWDHKGHLLLLKT